MIELRAAFFEELVKKSAPLAQKIVQDERRSMRRLNVGDGRFGHAPVVLPCVFARVFREGFKVGLEGGEQARVEGSRALVDLVFVRTAPNTRKRRSRALVTKERRQVVVVARLKDPGRHDADLKRIGIVELHMLAKSVPPSF